MLCPLPWHQMFERFTEYARRVVVLAQEEARILEHNYIGTEHILLGLLREEEGLAARALGSLGITVEAFRAVVVHMVGSGEEVTSGQIPFTPRAKKVLELALREALSLGHNYIGTEHILLGLVRENEGVAARILLDFDADSEKLRNEVIRMLSGPRAGRQTMGQATRGQVKRPKAGTSHERSWHQRLEALERANHIRLARAWVKRDLKRGDIDPAELFLDPPEEILNAKVFDLLLAAPGWGRDRINRAFAHARISPAKTVAGLSERQRLELGNLLRHPPHGGPAGPE